MPELPEIEVTRRVLRERLAGLRLEDAQLKREGKTVMPGAERLPELAGKRLTDVQRRGKMLVLEFDGGLSLLVHLMLIGRIALFPGGTRIPVEPRLRLFFEGPSTGSGGAVEMEVRFVAARSLGLVPAGDVDRHPTIAKQGPDALLLTREQFEKAVARTRGPVKDIFMDQANMAGVGNAYADEILHEARVHPMTPISALTEKQVDNLYSAIRPSLERAIEMGAAEEYLEDLGVVEGITAKHDLMRVHNRRGLPCPDCGTKVQMTVQKGRNTFCCPTCQKLPGGP
jgi:formamidopyrimidine-DNA glycosylase